MTPIFILAAGSGSKMFPFDKVGTKCLRPVANQPILLRLMETIRSCTDAPIVVAVRDAWRGSVAACCAKVADAEVFVVGENLGTADTLLALTERYMPKTYAVFYGDTLMSSESVSALLSAAVPAILTYPAGEDPSQWICCKTEQGCVTAIGAHHRGGSLTERPAAFLFDEEITKRLSQTPDYFPGMKVGEGAPCERYLEACLCSSLTELQISAVEGSGYFFDIDKPWQLMEADAFFRHMACESLTENTLAEGASIDPTAQMEGFVSLGKNSRIGRNVLIQGNVIVGDNTVIENGAMIMGEAMIGDRTAIRNYCQIYGGSTIGNDCIVDHGAEFLGGMIMDKVYLYHICEMYGLLGSCSDIGAGTVCGTLRFDDNEVVQTVNGRRERKPSMFANCAFLGDYSRTGAGAILQPGVKVGAYSVISPGAVVFSDVPHNTSVKLEQKLTYGSWGPERYGW